MSQEAQAKDRERFRRGTARELRQMLGLAGKPQAVGVSFTIPGDPWYEERTRAVNIPGIGIRQYTPKKTRAWKQRVADCAGKAMIMRGLLQGPIQIDVKIYQRRPGRLIWKRRPMPAIPAHTGPDWDNYGKAISDGCNGIVYRDDRQIADARVRKWYAAGAGYGDERARVEVVVSEVRDEPI